MLDFIIDLETPTVRITKNAYDAMIDIDVIC